MHESLDRIPSHPPEHDRCARGWIPDRARQRHVTGLLLGANPFQVGLSMRAAAFEDVLDVLIKQQMVPA